MHPNHRRTFLKSTALATTAALVPPSLAASTASQSQAAIVHLAAEGITGLLFSQVGYELGQPVRVVVRLPQKELLTEKATCLLRPLGDGKPLSTPCQYWGVLWDSHWWVAEFPALREPGEWTVAVQDKNQEFMKAPGLTVGKDILWEQTIKLASVDILERRKHFTKVGAGWQDAGTLWAESPAQSAMIVSLTELHDHCAKQFDQAFLDRLYEQLTVGCDYLVMTQEKALELGFPKGAMSHDLLGHEKDILPHDAMKAVVALLRSAKVLPNRYQAQQEKYRTTAQQAYQWLLTEAKPMGDYGYSRVQRGLSEDAKIPQNEWPTRDLLMMSQAALEMWKDGKQEAKAVALDHARQVMQRQITKAQAESGYYGHFREYNSLLHSETSWTHGIIANESGSQFGTDMGGVYPNYLMPLLEMLQLWSEHEDASRWKNTLRQFTYGYLIPACEKNPFYIVPQGIYGEEGPLWFCGTFHGTNTIYGYTAALALELSKLFNEPKLIPIAYGNLQWVAGLNGGITQESIRKGCVIFSTDVPEGVALPASMICHIGQRWAGTWFQTRGVICNGFSTGEQFKYDVPPLKQNDGPFSLTDEDWIPHSAAWVTALARFKNLS